jgi:hypothetical protein
MDEREPSNIAVSEAVRAGSDIDAGIELFTATK